MPELLLWLLACRCDGPRLPAPEPHYAEFDALVDLASRGSVAPAKELARDLDVADDDARLGSAVGFVQAALDAEELADGVAAMAAACGECHAQQPVNAPARPPFDHEHAARWAMWGLVWNASTSPPTAPDDRARQVAAAMLPQSEPQTQVAQALTACSTCHAGLR